MNDNAFKTIKEIKKINLISTSLKSWLYTLFFVIKIFEIGRLWRISSKS